MPAGTVELKRMVLRLHLFRVPSLGATIGGQRDHESGFGVAEDKIDGTVMSVGPCPQQPALGHGPHPDDAMVIARKNSFSVGGKRAVKRVFLVNQRMFEEGCHWFGGGDFIDARQAVASHGEHAIARGIDLDAVKAGAAGRMQRKIVHRRFAR